MKRAKMAAAFLACGLLVADCATDGTPSGGVDVYGGFYYDDYWWYGGGGCCVDYPGDIGPPPHPAHPIVLPPGGEPPKPTQPIAKPPTPSQPIASRPMPSPRPSMGGGGGRRR
jgi:hypothetical protein